MKYFVIELLLFALPFGTVYSAPLPPPPNDECSNAISLNALVRQRVDGNTTYARMDNNLTFPFQFPGFQFPGLWYKFETTRQTQLPVRVSTCNDRTNFNAKIVVVKGDDCGNLRFDFVDFFSGECGFDSIIQLKVEPNEITFIFVYGMDGATGTFSLISNSVKPRSPPNDECTNATWINPLVDEVVVGNTRGAFSDNDTGTVGVCNPEINAPGVWYKIENESPTALPVLLSTCDRRNGFTTKISVFQGLDCGKLVCFTGMDYFGDCEQRFGFLADAFTSYLILVHGYDLATWTFTLTASTAKLALPPNDECINATVLNPLLDKIVIGDTTNALNDNITSTSLDCGPYHRPVGPGVWYKIENILQTPLPVLLSTCNEGTDFGAEILVYKGNDCRHFECVRTRYSPPCTGGGTIFRFLAAAQTTYYIFGTGYAADPNGATGTFNMTVDANPNFLALIDSQKDSFIQVVDDLVDYAYLPSFKLNVQAGFGPSVAVKSVRMTFDRPKVSVCDDTAPYSVFGDSNGNFFNATIPLGSHLVTATPYARSRCQGTAGIPLKKKFSMRGCRIFFIVADTNPKASYSQCVLGGIDPSVSAGRPVTVSALPCSVNIWMRQFCGFPPSPVVRMELRNAITNKVIHKRTERQEPYYLFGDLLDSTGKSEVLSGSIPPGSYSILTFIDNIQYPAFNFTVGNGTCTVCEGTCSSGPCS
jgi:hypothetical protein